MKKIAQTAALVAGLAIILYLGISALADQWADDGAQYALTLALLLPVEILLAINIHEALKTGEVPVRFQVISRHVSPASYWFTVIFSGAMWLLMISISLAALRSLI